MAKQLNHYNTLLLKHNLSIILVCNYVSSPANLGMIFRNADAFGVEKIVLSPENVSFLASTRFKKIARNTAEQISHVVIETAEIQKQLQIYAKEDFQLVALDFTSTSKAIHKLNFQTKVCIILGHENSGIPNNLLSNIKTHAHIDLFGENSSINVAQALGISLYEITK